MTTHLKTEPNLPAADDFYDELIALNHIEDPRKLKIGQKLLIPKTTKHGKAHK